MNWRQKIVYDPYLKRPAAPEIQRAHGCALTVSYLFPKAAWSNRITKHMGIFEFSENQMNYIIQTVRNKFLRKKKVVLTQSMGGS